MNARRSCEIRSALLVNRKTENRTFRTNNDFLPQLVIDTFARGP